MQDPIHQKTVESGQVCMVVEDDQSLTLILTHMLQAFGCDVDFTTDDGHLVLKFLEKQAVAAIFMDLQMDKLSGEETLKLIKQRYPEQRVIIMSGDMGRQKQQEMLALGADATLPKPFGLEELEQILVQLKLLR